MANSIEEALRELLISGRVSSLRAGVHGTDEIGDWTVEQIQSSQTTAS